MTAAPTGHLAWLARYWRPYRWELVALAAFTLLNTAVSIAPPLVFRFFINNIAEAFTRARSTEGGVFLVLGLIALGRIITGFYPALRAWMNLRLGNAIREDHFAAILRKDHSFFSHFRTGDLLTRLTDDIDEYPRTAWFACSGIFRALTSFSMFIACIACMFYLQPFLATLSLLPFGPMFYIFYRSMSRLRTGYKEQQEAVSATNDLLEATFSGIHVVKAYNAEAGQQRRLHDQLAGRIGKEYAVQRLIALVHNLDTLATHVGQVIVLALGGLMLMQGRIDPGTLFAFYVFLEILVMPLWDLPQLFVAGRQAFVSIDRLKEIDGYPAPPSAPEAHAPIAAPARLSAETLGFRYRPDGPEAVAALDLTIAAGARLAIVGPVGAGKSTLLRLLTGELTPTAGRILLDGRPLTREAISAWRAHLGYVPQEALLFSATVEENIRLDRPPGPAGEVDEVLRLVQLEGELSGGLATMLGQKGTLVSGGQKQRIALARAILGRPRFLLLDDCTSALDSGHEEGFWEALEQRLGADTTVIVVSHRLSTVRRMREIAVLAGGRLLDRGTHDDLLSRCATYRELVEAETVRARVEVTLRG